MDVNSKGDMEAGRLVVFVMDEGELFSQPQRELISPQILQRLRAVRLGSLHQVHRVVTPMVTVMETTSVAYHAPWRWPLPPEGALYLNDEALKKLPSAVRVCHLHTSILIMIELQELELLRYSYRTLLSRKRLLKRRARARQ